MSKFPLGGNSPPGWEPLGYRVSTCSENAEGKTTSTVRWSDI